MYTICSRRGIMTTTATTTTVQGVPGPHPTRPGIKYPVREPPHSDFIPVPDGAGIWLAWRILPPPPSPPSSSPPPWGSTGGVQGEYRGSTGGVQGEYRGNTGGIHNPTSKMDRPTSKIHNPTSKMDRPMSQITYFHIFSPNFIQLHQIYIFSIKF